MLSKLEVLCCRERGMGKRLECEHGAIIWSIYLITYFCTSEVEDAALPSLFTNIEE